MKVTIVGLGLIGGSIARDLRASGFATDLVGLDLNPVNAARAIELGLVDRIEPEDVALTTSDVVVLSIPVGATCALLPSILDVVEKKRTIVIDVGSTKAQICKAASGHQNRGHFVAAHPLAGTENSGPDAALTGLFKGKINIICERDLSAGFALEVALKMFDAIGVKTIFMEAEEHDRHVAYVSHLSHVSSFLLGQTVLDIEKDEKNIFALASTGFASTVRLAKSSPDTWAPIFEQNSEYLSQALLEYIMHLQKFHYHLVKHDSKELHRILVRANEIRRVLEGIELKNEKNGNAGSVPAKTLNH